MIGLKITVFMDASMIGLTFTVFMDASVTFHLLSNIYIIQYITHTVQ